MNLRIEDVKGYLFSVPVRFRIAGIMMGFSHHLILTLRVGDHVGFGSAPLYGRMALRTMWVLWRDVLPSLRTLAATSLANLRVQVNQLLAGKYSSILYALDSALWDAEGRIEGVPVHELLGGSVRSEIPITHQVFISSWDSVLAELVRLLDQGVRALKVKVGLDPVRDVELVESIRAMVDEGFQIKLDANEGYTLDQAMQVGPAFHGLGVSSWEDPIRVSSWDDLRRLREHIGLPVMLDAVVRTHGELRDAIEHQALDVLNLKLTRIGGITQALRFTDLCREAGVAVSVGCSEDLGPAMASILHLSAVLNPLVGTEGIGWERLGFDCAIPSPVPTNRGTVELSEAPGLGVAIDLEGLRRAAQEHGFGVWPVHDVRLGFFWEGVHNVITQRSLRWSSARRS